MKQYILAHDLGTSGDKATLFDEDGVLIRSAVAAYQTKVFNKNWAEQHPSDWWDAVCSTSRDVLSHVDRSQLAAVSFSGQMMACLCVDAHGRPLHDAIIYCDQRSTEEERRMIDRIGMKEIYRITGHRPSASYSLAKLMWVREHLPDVYRSTAKVLQAKDYMNFMLTGGFFTDYNDATGTNAFDISKRVWSDSVLHEMDIPAALFPCAVPSSTVIGRVSKDAALATTIPEGTPVVVGSGDGGCATLGAGSISLGKPYCYMGSSSWVSITSDEPLFDDAMMTFTWAHPIDGLYHPCATMQTAGSSLSWFSSTFMHGEESENLEQVNDRAAHAPAGANGLLYLPYLLGERSPWWNPKAKAGFIGMHVNTTWEDMCRSVIEGIAMNLRISLEIMLARVPDRTVRFIGGGARGTTLRKVFSDVFGCDLLIPTLLTEATSMGAALLGGVGIGLYDDFSIVEKMNPIKEVVNPDVSLADLYQRKTETLKLAYQALTPVFDRMDA